MNDDQRLLASVALDGAATSEEQARVEADPEVVAEIERLRAVRAALQVGVTPDAARREAAIAAALAAFEATPPPPALAARRRSRWMAPLAAAAAVAAIAVGAVVVMRDGGGDDDLATEPLSLETAADDAGAAPEVAEERDILTEAPAATEAAQEEATEPSELTATAAVETLRSADELADFARRARLGEQADAGFDTVCDLGAPLGTADHVVDGTPVPVEVHEIAAPHEVVAASLESCAIIARAPLP